MSGVTPLASQADRCSPETGLHLIDNKQCTEAATQLPPPPPEMADTDS